jgi:amino acid adenylation domain-containing protein
MGDGNSLAEAQTLASTVAVDLGVATSPVDLLQARARAQPDAVAYCIVSSLEAVPEVVSYGGLDGQARRVAAALETFAPEGLRFALIFDTSSEFLSSLYGVLYAGGIAVTLSPARTSKGLVRLQAIFADAAPAAILTTPAIRAAIFAAGEACAFLTTVPILTPEDLAASPPCEVIAPRAGDEVAVLQYTSGSTSTPKGVEVTHANILANTRLIAEQVKATAADRGVTWAPMFHDMGLIGGVFVPMLVGLESVLIPPGRFIQRPALWLDVVTRWGATITHSPCFGYDLATAKISAQELAALDLRSLRIACCGAEPISAAMLDRFSDRFATCGFRRSAFFPVYALAEATLLVTGGGGPQGPRILAVDPKALETDGRIQAPGAAGTARLLVSSGPVNPVQTVIVADPLTGARRPDGEVGEIWVSGPCVARGYAGCAPETTATFQAQTSDGAGPYLRTGDLGFVEGGELFVTGRMKELIIVRGENHYPQDLEETARRCHPALEQQIGAAFAVANNELEDVVFIQEIPRALRERGADLVDAIRRDVGLQHGLTLKAVLLVRIGTLPKTSSGKLQRTAARAQFLANEVEAFHAWRAEDRTPLAPAGFDAPATPTQVALTQVIRDVLGIEDLGMHTNFFELGIGMDSLAAAWTVEGTERRLGVEIRLIDIYEAPTLAQLADLVEQRRLEKSGADPGVARLDPAPLEAFEPFPLTEVQEAYWVGRSPGLPLGGVATHAYRETTIRDFDLPRFEQALNTLIGRHAMLRAVIGANGRQRILETTPLYSLACDDFGGLAPEAREAGLAALRETMSHQVFDTERWPLFEFRAVRLGDGRTRLYASIDLLICDVWSSSIFARELHRLYREPATVLPPLEVSFRDYVLAARGGRSRQRRARAEAYWRDRLATLPAGPQLPIAQAPRPFKAPRFARSTSRLSAAAWLAFKNRAREAGVTPTASLITAFVQTLAAWSADPRFSLTLTVSHRLALHPQVDQLVGDFTRLLLLETCDDPATAFRDAARRVQEQLWRDLDHIDVDAIEVQRQLARMPGAARGGSPVVFTSMLGERGPQATGDPLAAFGESTFGLSQTPQVWLDYQLFEQNGELIFNWDYVETVFPAGLAEAMFAAHAGLLEALATTAETWTHPRRADDPPLLEGKSNAERDVRLEALFDAQAERAPDEPALITEHRTSSYGELRARALTLAAQLSAAGVGPGDCVPIVMEKGWEQGVAALGVLYAGAAYVPVSAAWPSARRAEIMELAGALFAVTQPRLHHELDWPKDLSVLVVADAEPDLGARNPQHGGTPDDLAYVIFTSGSTGQPKGVMVSHAAAANTLLDIIERFDLGASDRLFGISSLGFDLSVFDLFGTFAAGAALVLPEPGAERDPSRWRNLVREHGVTAWNSAPALADLLLDGADPMSLGGLRLMMVSGDWAPLSLPAKLSAPAPKARLVVLGGATEAAIWSIFHEVTEVPPEWLSIPYGRPLKNQAVYVLSARLERQPVWASGDIYIAGLGLALGYLGDPVMTAERFIKHPRTGERLYRTGDLGRYMPSGEIEFLGRVDNQVKIAGHRIELGDVEAALQRHPDVAAAAAVAVGELRGFKRLAAFVVLEAGAEVSIERLREWLRHQLPAYMAPGVLRTIERLPLSDNGKVDRNALVQLAAAREPDFAMRDPASALESEIGRIVAEVLGRPVSPTDDLLEAGATSLDIIRIGNALVRELNLHLDLERVFELPTVRGLAQQSTPTGAADANGPAVLVEAAARDAAKAAWRTARASDLAGSSVTLGLEPTTLPRRRSCRTYSSEIVPADALAKLLSILAEVPEEGDWRFAYPSAGGLYPVVAYVHAKAGRIAGLAGGLYRYNSRAHALQIAGAAEDAVNYLAGDANAVIYDEAAFVVVLVADLAAAAPLYGDAALRFSLIEAGAMAQLLSDSAADLDLGLCVIGAIDGHRAPLGLQVRSGRSALLALTGGLPASAARETAAQAETPDKAYEHGFI